MGDGSRKGFPLPSRYTFGLGSLHRLPLPGQRQRLIWSALEAGFRAFDVAPAYGNGLGEVELGMALVGHRSEVSITTKYGIPMPLYGGLPRFLFPVLRVADKFANPAYSKRHLRRCFEPRALSRSLDGSLRRLKTDYVDFFLIHEPLAAIPEALFEQIADTADRLKESGKIRRFGVGGSLTSVGGLVEHRVVEVVQAPLGELLDVGIPRQTAVCAYGVYQEFQARGKRHENFLAFVKDLQAMDGNLGLILATTKLATLASLKKLLE